jgi:hypothetical protein
MVKSLKDEERVIPLEMVNPQPSPKRGGMLACPLSWMQFTD